jgi:hypothetical protein
VAEWSAEVVVDEPPSRRLIGGQFPDFAGARSEGHRAREAEALAGLRRAS